ncbi:Cell death abnormality protein 1 [Aphelenchoides fujianensis]|nr:Cell death abnormality protein 1 [Aphelenchoides fujianensis]
MDWRRFDSWLSACVLLALTQPALAADESPLPPNVTLSGPNVCRDVVKVINGVKLERYTQNVTLETYVGCSDPFQNFRCKETKTGTRINYKSVPKEVDQYVDKCCEGFAQTGNLTCEKLAEPERFVQPESNSNVLITLVIVSLTAIVVVSMLLAVYYRRKMTNKKKFEHAVKYTPNSDGQSDEEDEVDNRVFRPGFVQPSPVRPPIQELKPAKVELPPTGGANGPHPPQNVYVELGAKGDDEEAAGPSAHYETIPAAHSPPPPSTAYRASNPISFENPNSLYPNVPSPDSKSEPRV